MKTKMVMSALFLASSVVLAKNEHSKPLVFESKYDFQQTVTTLTDTFKEKGMKVFTHIDHQQAAKEVGLEMQPATVIVYGTPKVGTPLMVKDPSLALQLPLKVLVTQTSANRVDVVLNSAEQVVSRSNTEYAEVENTLAKAEKLIKTTVSK